MVKDGLAGAWEFEDGVFSLRYSSNIAGFVSLNIAIKVAVIFLVSVSFCEWETQVPPVL